MKKENKRMAQEKRAAERAARTGQDADDQTTAPSVPKGRAVSKDQAGCNQEASRKTQRAGEEQEMMFV